MKKIFFILVLISVFYSCKTDFDVNAPYDKTPIVYGLIDQSVDTQYVKINKTFLGSNNLTYSRINDSTHFKNVNARVEQWKNGSIKNVYQLQSKQVPVSPSDGIFYTDYQTVYYFVESNLDLNSTYKLIGTGDGKDFSSETELIQNFDFVLRFRNYVKKTSGLVLALDGGYGEIKPEWSSAKDGKRYDMSLRFHYNELRNGVVTPKFIDWNMGTKKSIDLEGGENMFSKINAEGFFIYIGNKLSDTIGVTKRVIGNVEFRVTSANEVLNTFMEVNEPISTIASERPEFTNIEGGYGIFASRYVLSIFSTKLSEKTVEELHQGQHTSNLKFCSNDPAYFGEAYYCP